MTMPKWAVEKVFLPAKLDLRAAGDGELPPGVCGRLTGIALTYNVADDYGTVFMPGCLSKTRAEKVNTGKVRLFADHGPFTDTHVGVVRSLEDMGDAAVMVADLFDTEAGRAMKEYLASVLASGADTGLSIGFRPRDKEWRADADGDMQCWFKEVELREISITPVPAVPGTAVTSVRAEPGETDEHLLARALRSILMALPKRDALIVFDAVYSAAPADTSDAVPSTSADAATDADENAESAGDVVMATDEERLRVVRASYSSL